MDSRKKANMQEQANDDSLVMANGSLITQPTPISIKAADLSDIPPAMRDAVIDPKTGFLMINPHTSMSTGNTYDLKTVEQLVKNGDTSEYVPNYCLKSICDKVRHNYQNNSFNWAKEVEEDLQDATTLEMIDSNAILTKEGITHDAAQFKLLQEKIGTDPITKRKFDKNERTIENRSIINIIEYVKEEENAEKLKKPDKVLAEVTQELDIKKPHEMTREELQGKVKASERDLKEANEQLERIEKEREEQLARHKAEEVVVDINQAETQELTDEELQQKLLEADKIMAETAEQLDRLEREREAQLTREKLREEAELTRQKELEQELKKPQQVIASKEKLEEEPTANEQKRKQERDIREQERLASEQKRKQERDIREQERLASEQKRKQERDEREKERLASEQKRKQEKEKLEKERIKNSLERDKLRREEERRRLRKEAERSLDRHAANRLAEKKEKEKQSLKEEARRREMKKAEETQRLEAEVKRQEMKKAEETQRLEAEVKRQEMKKAEEAQRLEAEMKRQEMKKAEEAQKLEEDRKRSEHILQMKKAEEERNSVAAKQREIEKKTLAEVENKSQEDRVEDKNIMEFLKTTKFPQPILKAITDPMTGFLMRDPVVLKTGNVRERKALVNQGLREGVDFSTNAYLQEIANIIRQDYRGGVPPYETMEQLRRVYNRVTREQVNQNGILDKNLQAFCDYFREIEGKNRKIAEEQAAKQNIIAEQKLRENHKVEEKPSNLLPLPSSKKVEKPASNPLPSSQEVEKNVKATMKGLEDIQKRTSSIGPTGEAYSNTPVGMNVKSTIHGLDNIEKRASMVVSGGSNGHNPPSVNLNKTAEQIQKPASRWGRFKQWVKDHKKGLIIAAVVIGVVVIASVLTFGITAVAVGVGVGGGVAALGVTKVAAGTLIAAKVGAVALGAKGIAAVTVGAATATGIGVGSTAYLLSKSDEDASLAPLAMSEDKELGDEHEHTNFSGVGATLFNHSSNASPEVKPETGKKVEGMSNNGLFQ